MTDRIDKFGLQVARPLHDMIEREALPLTGVASDTFWQGLVGPGPRLRPAEPRAAAPGATTCRRRSMPGTASIAASRIDAGGLPGLPRRDRLPRPRRPGFRDRHGERRPRDRQHAGPAARRAGDERALRAERGECPLGQPLRRAVRHGRDGRPAAGRRLRRGAWRPCDRVGEEVPRLRGAARAGAATPTRRSIASSAAGCGRDDRSGATALANPALFAGYRGRRRRADRRPAAGSTACTSKSRSTAPTASARPIRRAWPTCGSKRRSRRSWTARIPSRPSTPRTRRTPTATGSA